MHGAERVVANGAADREAGGVVGGKVVGSGITVVTASRALLVLAKACRQISEAVEVETSVISSIFLNVIGISRHLKVTMAARRRGVISFPI